jgi:hypothetical protein
MLLLVLIPAVWIAGSGFIVLLCRMAALSDREQERRAPPVGPVQIMSLDGILGWDWTTGPLSAARLRPAARSSERVAAAPR